MLFILSSSDIHNYFLKVKPESQNTHSNSDNENMPLYINNQNQLSKPCRVIICDIRKQREPRMSRKFALAPRCLFLCLVMFLCIYFINILVSSPTFERGKKENHLNSGDPEEGEQNPEVRSKLALRALPLAAYLVNISTSFLLSKHVNWCRCTLDWPGQAGIEILFVLYFFFFVSLPNRCT